MTEGGIRDVVQALLPGDWTVHGTFWDTTTAGGIDATTERGLYSCNVHVDFQGTVPVKLNVHFFGGTCSYHQVLRNDTGLITLSLVRVLVGEAVAKIREHHRAQGRLLGLEAP